MHHRLAPLHNKPTYIPGQASYLLLVLQLAKPVMRKERMRLMMMLISHSPIASSTSFSI